MGQRQEYLEEYLEGRAGRMSNSRAYTGMTVCSRQVDREGRVSVFKKNFSIAPKIERKKNLSGKPFEYYRSRPI